MDENMDKLKRGIFCLDVLFRSEQMITRLKIKINARIDTSLDWCVKIDQMFINNVLVSIYYMPNVTVEIIINDKDTY